MMVPVLSRNTSVSDVAGPVVYISKMPGVLPLNPRVRPRTRTIVWSGKKRGIFLPVKERQRHPLPTTKAVYPPGKYKRSCNTQLSSNPTTAADLPPAALRFRGLFARVQTKVKHSQGSKRRSGRCSRPSRPTCTARSSLFRPRSSGSTSPKPRNPVSHKRGISPRKNL